MGPTLDLAPPRGQITPTEVGPGGKHSTQIGQLPRGLKPQPASNLS